MNSPEIYQCWAPKERIWSQWAKPVLFAYCSRTASGAPIPFAWPTLNVSYEPSTALVLDLPRELAVNYGIAAAGVGYWPVPLFNCADGMDAALNVAPIIHRLSQGADELQRSSTPIEAAPAFLIDSGRMSPDAPLSPGKFDNRYIILPQDFPSAGYLNARGIHRILWLYRRPGGARARTPADDLCHVFRRWQESGLQIWGRDVDGQNAELIQIHKPSFFRSIFYRAIVLLGLRRNSAGGFGGIIPQPYGAG